MLRMVKIMWLLGLCTVVRTTHAVQPVLSNTVITDVSDRAFSLFLTSDQIGRPSLDVFTDANGVNLVPGLNVSSYNIHTGSPALTNIDRLQSKESIAQALKEKGIVKFQVAGLSPDTNYYLRVSLQSDVLLETTSCPDDGVPFCLDIQNLIPIKTAKKSSREDITSELFMNDALLYLSPLIDAQMNLGEVLIISSENSQYPVSAIIGDGVTAPYALVDLNNIYGDTTGKSLKLIGANPQVLGNTGEAIIVKNYKGVLGDTTDIAMLAINQGAGVLMMPMEISYGDCNADGVVNGYDELLLANVMAGVIGSQEYQITGFHPIICNLYKEGGVHSLKVDAVIDQVDANLLLDLLIGKIGLESLPGGL